MSKPFQIAVVSTTFYIRSHSDVIATRWTTPRPADPIWGWSGPSSQLASIHIEQITERDTGVAWAKENNIPLMGSIEEAITLGTGNIAVNAVLIIGEHGDYPQNEYDQKTYPRKRLFDSVVAVFKKYGKVLPVFNDKHYSYNPEWAVEMYQTAKAMGFPLLGGSSIPHTPFEPEPDLARGFKPRKALSVYYGDKEAYLYHSYEFAQSILEKRAGGEAGIRGITVYTGEQVWDELEKRFGNELLDAAISRGRKINPGDRRENCAKAQRQPMPILTIAHHADGLESGHVNLSGHCEGWSTAIETEDGRIHSTGATDGGEDVWYAHFATFSKLIEEFFKTGKYPFASERALLTSVATDLSLYAFMEPGKPLETPLAMIPYQPLPQDAYYHPKVKADRKF